MLSPKKHVISISDNVRQDLVKLLPASVINDVACFVFYDNHPKDENVIDITICTVHGEVKEFFQRDLMRSLYLGEGKTPSKIIVLRNSKSELFYLVEVGDELHVLFRGKELRLFKVIPGIAWFVNDFSCNGQSYLKVMRENDEPLYFDDNLDSMGEVALFLNKFSSDVTLPLIKNLMQKLTEARYGFKASEKAYKELLKFRQTSAFSSYGNINPNIADGLYDSERQSALKLKSQKPWFKICNKKIVIAIEAVNTEKLCLEDVHILMHRTVKSSVIYTTKLFSPLPSSPFWSELNNQIVFPQQEVALVTVIDLKELKYDVNSIIKFQGVVCYRHQGKEYLLPFENVVVSASDIMGEKFDLLPNLNAETESNVLLALLSTTEKYNLCLRPLKSVTEDSLTVTDIFCKYLVMEKIPNTENIVVHKVSPYHTLYGIMAILPDESDSSSPFVISLHTRCSSQVLPLIHLIHDTIPNKIVITSINHKLTAKTNELAEYNEDTSPKQPNSNLIQYGTSVLKQSKMVLDYLDKCMIKMQESNDPNTLSKIGTEVDLFAGGVDSYKEFRKKFLDEGLAGAESVDTDVGVSDFGTEIMAVDVD